MLVYSRLSLLQTAFIGWYLSILKTRVENYSLASHLTATQARILMLGPIGAGKSSFFNTINNIFQERITSQATTGTTKGSLTMNYRQYKVRSKSTVKELNLRLCDTRGIEAKGRPDLADLNYLIEGNVPTDMSETPIGPDLGGFISQPGVQNKVHCVVFVFEASSVKGIDTDIWDKLTQLHCRMNRKAIPRVVLLTKIDRISEPLKYDVSKVFLSKAVKRAVEYVSEQLRIPTGNVMPVKNYERENDLDNGISCLALQALDRMLGYAHDFLVEQYDRMHRDEAA